MSQERRIVVGYLILFAFVLAAVFLVSYQSTNEARRGCERLDQVRAVEWDVLEAAANRPETPPQISAFYRQQLDDLVESTLPWTTGVDAHIDCEAAYPFPPPLSWFG